MNKLTFILVLILFIFGNAFAGCYSDYNCNYGDKCVKTQATGQGICVTLRDQYGNKQYNFNPGTGTKINGCLYDTDCGYGNTCLKQNGQIYGYCVK